ncbi:Glycosyltransferase involved in cell wall bisynthesis [Fibrobacter sp. UWR3]|nr:Glycosyltransferase involved in cell wall bisynthesis [Fibrobacter sp. UWR3]
MKVAFYLTNRNIADKDCRNVLDGNPGIGGTYYAMLLLAQLISLRPETDVELVVFAESLGKLPAGVPCEQTENLQELSKKIETKKIDILVVNKIGKNTLDKSFFHAIRNNNVKVVIWAHCFISYPDLVRYAKNKKIFRIVAVGKEQLMTFCDHSAFKKSTYIYNICNYPIVKSVPFRERSNNVVYIGSIVSLKGLHLLTKAWPMILKEFPDANLFVIGSGKLYNKNAKLGKYGIAEYFYEKKLLKPILDAKGSIIPSVHFCGIMGREKYDILKTAKVGVPNPSGLTETFGFTAIEMQLAGCSVTTIKCPGYLDTIYDKKALYSDPSQLADFVIARLKQKKYDADSAIQFVESEFSAEKILPQWYALFREVYEGKSCETKIYNTLLESSIRKIKNRKLQLFCSFLPSLMFYEWIFGNIFYFFSRMVHIYDTIHKIIRRYIWT